jgi:hypothetical protein
MVESHTMEERVRDLRFSTERSRDSWTEVEKQKLESVENIPAF